MPSIIIAQNISLKGNIVEAKSEEPLPGATILIKGTAKGVTSDFDGNFELDVKENQTGILVISYLGYQTKEISFNKETAFLNVALNTATEQLNEIVITAEGIKLRLVEKTDAEFIVDLRTDKKLGQNISWTSASVEKQIAWIEEYKIDGFRFDFTKGFSNTEHKAPDLWGSNYDAKRIEILKNYALYIRRFRKLRSQSFATRTRIIGAVE